MGLCTGRHTGLVVAATACRPGKSRRTLVRSIDVIAQTQKFRTGSLTSLFLLLDKEQISEGSSVGSYADIWERRDMCDCPEHMATLLKQALRVCTDPGQERQVQQMLAAYADAFSSAKADVRRSSLLKHSISVEPGMAPLKQPFWKLGLTKDKNVEQ